MKRFLKPEELPAFFWVRFGKDYSWVVPSISSCGNGIVCGGRQGWLNQELCKMSPQWEWSPDRKTAHSFFTEAV